MIASLRTSPFVCISRSTVEKLLRAGFLLLRSLCGNGCKLDIIVGHIYDTSLLADAAFLCVGREHRGRNHLANAPFLRCRIQAASAVAAPPLHGRSPSPIDPLLKKSTVDFFFPLTNINLTPQITAGAAAGWPAEASSARGCFAGAPGRHMRCSAASRRWRCRLRRLRCGSSSASSERSEPYAGLCFCFGALGISSAWNVHFRGAFPLDAANHRRSWVQSPSLN